MSTALCLLDTLPDSVCLLLCVPDCPGMGARHSVSPLKGLEEVLWAVTLVEFLLREQTIFRAYSKISGNAGVPFQRCFFPAEGGFIFHVSAKSWHPAFCRSFSFPP